jgi:fatty-acyl-CoA synthase
MKSMLGAARRVASTLRTLSNAEILRLRTLAGARAFASRAAVGDLHPSIIWPVYAADRPNDLALVQDERRRTWREANARINRLANALVALGISAGDRIGIMIENSIEWFEIMIACQKIGLSTVAVSYRSTPSEIGYLLEDSEAAVLFFGASHDAVVEEARRLVSIPERFAIRIGGTTPLAETADYEALIASGSEEEPPASRRSGGSRAILYTSGTTGRPKGAVRDLSKAGIGALVGLLERIPFRRSDRHLVAAPLYHATGSGFAMISATLGSTIHLMRHFEPEEFLRIVDRERITTTAVVPTMLRAIVDLPVDVIRRYDTSSLRVVVTTGSALPEPVEHATLEVLGDVLYDLYGSTEMGFVTVAGPGDKHASPGTIGLPVPGVDVVLLDDAKQPVADGEVGELYARSRLTIEGYHRNETATAESRYGDYFSVGDLAIRDARGYLTLVGRKKDMVISGGMNVYPAEIETVLLTHPAIREAAVVGVPDEKWGEALVAFVTPHDGAELPSDEELVAFLKKSLAGYKVPRRFERIAELPRNPTGKVLKRDLQTRVG